MLGAGRYRVRANYLGDTGLRRSTSGTRDLRILRAATHTVLRMSTRAVGYGREHAAVVSVRVRSRYSGMPGGLVTIFARIPPDPDKPSTCGSGPALAVRVTARRRTGGECRRTGDDVRFSYGRTAAVAAIIISAGPLAGPPASAAPIRVASAVTADSWGMAATIPGLGPLAATITVSCPATGYCAAVGVHNGLNGTGEVFVISERNGVWGTPQPIPGLAALDVGHGASVGGLSCASPGNCAVGGSYTDTSNRRQAFVATEIGGTWGSAIELPGTAALNTGGNALTGQMSCTAPGDCGVAGVYLDAESHFQVFVASEVNGTWQDAIEVPGTAILNTANAQAFTLSCAAPGDCVIGGRYQSAPSVTQAYLASEVNGVWQDAIEVPGTAVLNAGGYAAVNSVSCPVPGTCTAAGTYTDAGGKRQAFVASEVNGAWQDAIELPGTAALNAGAYAAVSTVSCPAPETCTAGGTYTDAGGHEQVFVASKVNGTWHDAIELPGTAALNAGGYAEVNTVSCSAPGTCAAGGDTYTATESSGRAFVADEVNGTWQNAEQVPGTATPGGTGLAAVISLSCAPHGTCAAGGLYGYQFGRPGTARAFVVSQTQAGGTATSLRLSARTTRAGHEHTERLTVTVSPGTPYGLAIVTAIAGPGRSARLCLITVRAGTGTCHLTNSALPAGTYQVTARFLGGNTLTPSASPAQTLHVEAAHGHPSSRSGTAVFRR